MGFLDRISECNARNNKKFFPFVCGSQVVGYVSRDVLCSMQKQLKNYLALDGKTVKFQDHIKTSMDRTQALETLRSSLIGKNFITNYAEKTPVVSQWGERPQFVVAKPLMLIFGFYSFGVHVNGLVKKKDGSVHMWLGKRAAHLYTFPSKWDQVIAGSQPHGISVQENLIKEGQEEAGFSPELIKTAKNVGMVSYHLKDGYNTERGGIFCYDLWIPEGLEPYCTDGEVERFELFPIEDVVKMVRDKSVFKTNCNLVLIDCFLRHGYIDERNPDYKDIVRGLGYPKKKQCNNKVNRFNYPTP